MDDILRPEILVLDDEPFMRMLLVQILANLGFSLVTECGAGTEALEWLDRQPSPPDVILCDLNMPGMDGIEFLRNLATRHYAGSLILVSGESERMLQSSEMLVRAHDIEILGYLQKPVSPAALAAQMAKWSPALPAQPDAKTTYTAQALQRALTRGELINYYQPKVDVATGRLVGVETLVRWCHPHDGIVYPDQFIPVAEEQGLIDELTHQVLIGALMQTRKWQDAGLMFSVAINVSMDNLATLAFADFVSGQAAAIGVAPQHIVLEVTESRLMTDLRAPLEILTRLRLKRFVLSIDDFGTGNSSLTQLREIPFDELKIDRGFVHEACVNETVKAMYDASCGLGRQLGMKIVAEGVEDQNDWNFLRRRHCDLAQGYFIARPMPAADLPGWMKAWQDRAGEWGTVDADLPGPSGA